MSTGPERPLCNMESPATVGQEDYITGEVERPEYWGYLPGSLRWNTYLRAYRLEDADLLDILPFPTRRM